MNIIDDFLSGCYWFVETEVKQEWTDRHSLVKNGGVVSKSVPLLISGSSHHCELRGFKTDILSQQFFS